MVFRPLEDKVESENPANSASKVETRPLNLSDEARVGKADSQTPLNLLEALNASLIPSCITFAGQGVPCIDALADLFHTHDFVKALVKEAQKISAIFLKNKEIRWSPHFTEGLDLLDWIEDASSRPAQGYLTSTAVSQALIFTTQIAQYHQLVTDGLDRAVIGGVTGHSQGMMSALYISEMGEKALDIKRFGAFFHYFLWQGFHMAEAYPPEADTSHAATTMAAISGPNQKILQNHLDRFNKGREKGEYLYLSLFNTRTRHVVSGPASRLAELQAYLEQTQKREADEKRAGKRAGTPLNFTWEFLEVGGPFHSPHMETGYTPMLQRVQQLGFEIQSSDLEIPVICPATGRRLDKEADLTHHLVTAQFIMPVHWVNAVEALRTINRANLILDLGPGDGVARLSRSSLRGTPTRILAISENHQRLQLFDPPVKPPIDYGRFNPSLIALQSGQHLAQNRYTQATGHLPIILPGMTPTTVDVDIVANAANAGYTAELAGGGQVSERIFWLRMEELAEKLEPGREITFNALHLDPYLWGLHLGKHRLVQRAREKGYPICGVTITAGIPEKNAAVTLLNELFDLGIWLNALKPGTVDGVKKTIEIAKAMPEKTLFIHLEGGKAGGHHSFENLDDLLLATYSMIRECKNLVLCVGGGVSSEDRAVSLLTGTWAKRYNQRPMPVDAVFLGTLAMACKEASASPQVKAALVAVAGTQDWVFTGQSKGDITSGKSQLNADIHYLDNAAAHCGRLLDEVAGKADAVQNRRQEIVDALNQTAKPYFGDVEQMTYAQALDRMVQLLAVGYGSRYEDGVWPDHSFRQRVFDFLRRVEGRLNRSVGPFTPLFEESGSLDNPQAALAQFYETYPACHQDRVHPADVHYFIHNICRRPGKPVNFVPVIDADVRRWYKADSLWQAQDPRYRADQVLIIPGPEAVQGLKSADEPIADLLGRFNQALIDTIQSNGQPASPRILLQRPTQNLGDAPICIEGDDHSAQGAYLQTIAGYLKTPLDAVLLSRTLVQGRNHIPNPLHRLLLNRSGATIRIQSGGHGLTYAVAGREHERLSLDLQTEDSVRLQVQMADSRGPIDYTIHWPLAIENGALTIVQEEADALGAIQHLYGHSTADEGDLLAPHTAELALPPAQLKAYRALTGLNPQKTLPINALFSLAVEPLFKILCHSEVADGLLNLVHLENAIETFDGWPVLASTPLDGRCQLVEWDENEKGRTLETEVAFSTNGQVVAKMRSRFFITVGVDSPRRFQNRECQALIDVSDKATLKFLMERDWIIPLNDAKPLPQGQLDLRVDMQSSPLEAGFAHRATGHLYHGTKAVARIALSVDNNHWEHPIDTLLTLLKVADKKVQTPVKSLAETTVKAPKDLQTFAEVSGDFNPIHTQFMAAQLAGLGAPIVHGMWTAARLYAFMVKRAADGDETRLNHLNTRFLAPVPLGATLHFEVQRHSIESGALGLHATAALITENGPVNAAIITAKLAPATTAYCFPGQGIQQQGMGMAGYARSAAAKAVWDNADRYTRENLGFSVLQMVRENPKSLKVGDSLLRHPKGLLNMTQFTQVAMAVLAQAQVAELKESGAYIERAVTCGHSVGEYNALSAIVGVLPLEDVVDIVYHRGLVMHHLIPRNADGESPYRMGVIRPHYAGLDHQAAEELVSKIAEQSGYFIQIVNYNVRGRQYSVTGHLKALTILQKALAERQRNPQKPAYIEVPGIDVPFHSSLLLNGVDSFRKTLEKRFPDAIDASKLLGVYVPNLYPKPFSLKRDYIEAVYRLTESPVLKELLAGDGPLEGHGVARALLIELLAYQFASPVRWIETQELLFTPKSEGGLGVKRLIEVGVGYQPTVANMAQYSLSLMPTHPQVAIYNCEAHRDTVLERDKPQPKIEKIDAPAEASSKAPEATVPQAQAPAPVQVAAPAAQGPLTDHPFGVKDGLIAMLALQAKVRPDQIPMTETIDGLFDGVSSRRNQVLMDIGTEFGIGTIDGAHEKALGALIEELDGKVSNYQKPGAYLTASFEEASKRLFGRAGLRLKDVGTYLENSYAMPSGLIAHVQTCCALETRDGASSRDGDLARISSKIPTDKAAAHHLIDEAATFVGQACGQAIAPIGQAQGQGGSAVDSAVVEALGDRIVGKNGVLMQNARQMAEILGHAPKPTADNRAELAELQSQLAELEAEHGPEYAGLLRQRFEQEKHVVFNDRWATAQADVAFLYYDAINQRLDDNALYRRAASLNTCAKHERVQLTSRYFAKLAHKNGHAALAQILENLASGQLIAPLNHGFTRPHLEMAADGTFTYAEKAGTQSTQDWLYNLWRPGQSPRVTTEGWDGTYKTLLASALKAPLDFKGQTALITGASPRSIALEIARHLLAGGARVILTTTSYHAQRLEAYREVFRNCAAHGAELHIVPFNQASFQDVDNLVDWLFTAVTEQAGATVKVVKEPFYPDMIIPFAALSDNVTSDQQGARSLVAARVQLHGVNRLITRIAKRYMQNGLPKSPCHILLPLSPNHGVFGGDGSYAETKAALEVFLNKWQSEQAAWAKATTFCGAKIGWVRGTGLMDQNDRVAAELESKADVYTFSSAEMGLLLATLLTPEARQISLKKPLKADLTGGMAAVGNLGEIVGDIRTALHHRSTMQKRYNQLKDAEKMRQGQGQIPQSIEALVDWPHSQANHLRQNPSTPQAWPKPKCGLKDMVVIVGAGEVGPWGSARTRFDFECTGKLSPAAILELAWTTGLIQFDKNQGGGVWVDSESGETIAESQIAARYGEHIHERSGIRFADAKTTGFDVNGLPVHTTVYLDRDFTFEVSSLEEGKAFIQADPEHTRLHYNAERECHMVTRLAGTEVKVLKEIEATRRVLGLVPEGFDFSRFGITPEMLESIDRLTLFNLIATVDAFIGAGLSPEELLSHIHPAKVGNTQGAGIGGMQSLSRLYVDHLLDRERQNDTLQETLINVIAAYVVQSYVGSYGPMSNPVAACATAAVSVEEALDKIQLGKADFVVAGGFDDVGSEGLVGFADMAATAETSEMLAMGLEPRQMSRANDRRRKGFVEAQGGGTILMTRGDIAARLGLPVLGVVGYAGSFSDGVHTSIPAPGMGALAAAMGGLESVLGQKLTEYGLSADDIGVVYKHDTSTNANDPNENSLHHQIQDALRRSPGNPLWAVSQKTITGHPKGGAAAWQLNGICQSMNSGLIPGNRNLECVDGKMAQYKHIAFNNKLLDTGAPIKAGLVTSLGFGHVSALLLVINQASFMHAMSEEEQAAYQTRLAKRQNRARATWARVFMGDEIPFEKRRARRFLAPDGSAAQNAEEAAMLLNPMARLDLETGIFTGEA